MPELPKARSALSPESFDEIFSRGLEAHARAETLAVGPIRRQFRIAGATVEFRVTSIALAMLFCDALAHIEIPDEGEPDFTFHIWDEASSGIDGPSLNGWENTELSGLSEITEHVGLNCYLQVAHDRITALIGSDRYLQVDHDRAMVSAAHKPTGNAVVWLRSHNQGLKWECGSPLLTMINWWASEFGYLAVHAGSVGRADGGVLIVGRSGSGKSHAAIACLESDLFYVGDDHCLLSTNEHPISTSLYSTAKLFLTDLHRFPTLQKNEKEALLTPEGKAVFFLKGILPDRLLPGVPVRAVLLSHFSGRRDTQVQPAHPSEALLAMGSYNVLRWPSFGRTPLARFASILRSLPCFRIETGTDISQIPRAIASVLDRAQASETA